MSGKSVQIEKAYEEPFVLVPTADAIEMMRRVKPSAVCVYLAILTHANRKAGNTAYPSTSTIAREANVSRRTVVSAVQELQQAGILTVTPRFDDKNGQTSSLYRLHRIAAPCADSAHPPVQDLHTPYANNDTTPVQNLHTNQKNYEPEEEGPEENPHEASFVRFWEVWPKKVDKEDAYTVWMRLKPSASLVDTIIRAVEEQTANNWIDTPKRFMPGPAKWLRGKKWNDEIIAPEADKPAAGKPAPASGHKSANEIARFRQLREQRRAEAEGVIDVQGAPR